MKGKTMTIGETLLIAALWYPHMIYLWHVRFAHTATHAARLVCVEVNSLISVILFKTQSLSQ